MSEKGLARVTATDIQPIKELEGWATLAVKAQIIPNNMNVYQAMSIVQAGKEMGLQPLQSLRSMSFIKGRLSMSVQLQLAMAKKGGVTMDDPIEEDGSCEVTLHRGKESVTCVYTRADAKKAGLIVSGGNWDKYERQMLRWRAIGDALRLIAPDYTMNLLSPEEALSIDPVAPLPVEALPVSAPVIPPSGAGPQGAANPAEPAVEKPPPTPPTENKKTSKEKLSPEEKTEWMGKLEPKAYEYMKLTGINEEEALEFATKSDKFDGFKAMFAMKYEWQFKNAIAKLEDAINKLNAIDEDDVPL